MVNRSRQDTVLCWLDRQCNAIDAKWKECHQVHAGFDRGRIAEHALINIAHHAKCYFAEPYSSCQRGTLRTLTAWCGGGAPKMRSHGLLRRRNPGD